MPEPMLLSAVGVSKSFPGVRALRSVSLDVRPGEVHCLLGENGAGKSTLVKILTGAETPDGGHVEVRGRRVGFSSPATAQRAGVSAIYQELDLLPDMTVAQNLFLGHEPSRIGVVRIAERRRRAQAILDELGCRFGAHTRVGTLSLAEQQMTALAKALTIEADVIVMDEPSAALNERELERLLGVIRDVVARGRSVIYVSHRLGEIMEIGDRATVLRDGEHVATVELAGLAEKELVGHMIGSGRAGSEHPDGAGDQSELQDGPPLLEVRSARVPGVLEVEGVTVRAGEVVGLTGLVGCGRSTLLNGLFGSQPLALDADLAGDGFAPRRPADAIRRGVALVPEDRKGAGLVLDLPVATNLALPSYGRLASRGVLRPRRVREHAGDLIERLSVRCSGPGQSARTLSGGNQQKLVLGKWLSREPRLLLLDEPTRGLDLGAKAAVFDQVRRLAADGLGALVASSELSELLTYCDRIYVLHEGRLVDERRAAGEHRDRLLTAAITGEAA